MSKKLKARDIARAFNNHKHVLKHGHDSYLNPKLHPPGTKLYISNEIILLRNLLIELGFRQETVDGVLNFTGPSKYLVVEKLDENIKN